ncbi:MAG: polysaccharide biosynthesis C-terminal domain-containing protein, partial [Bacteroidota bacterium]
WPLDGLYDTEDRVKYIFLANMIASIVVLILLIPSYFNLNWRFDSALMRKMIWYAAPLTIAQLAGAINMNIGFHFIKNFASADIDFNKTLEGPYSAALKIAIIMTLFTQAFNYAAEPFFFRNDKREDSKEVYAQIAQAFSIVGVLVFLGVLLYLDVLKYLISADKWSGFGIIPIFLLAYLFLGLFYNFSIWYKLTDQTKIGGYIAIGGSLITLLLNALLVPAIGIYGPAWAALFCFVFMAGAAYWTGQKNYKIDYPIREIGLYIIIGLSGYFLSEWGKGIWEGYLFPTLFMNTLILLGCLIGFYFVDSNFADSIFRNIPGRKKSK